LRIAVVMPTLPFPGDVRVEPQVRALVADGHEVEVLAAGEPGRPSREEALGARVRRVGTSARSLKLSNLLLKITSYRWHPVWSRAVRKLMAGGFDAVHVHELKPFYPAWSAARRQRTPVVLDLREDYPEMEKGASRKLSWRLFNSVRKIEKVQGRACRLADAVLVVSPKFADIFCERYPEVPRAKMLFVSNYADVDAIQQILDSRGEAVPDERFTLTYVGSMGTRERGIQVAIEGMHEVLQSIPEARLVLVGSGGYLEALREMVERQGLGASVSFEGQVGFEEVPRYIQRSSVCIIPSLNETHETDFALPLKLFQYMLLARPVLTSDCSELERIVETSGAGLVFRSGDAADFAVKVLELNDAALREQMGARGRQAVLQEFNFEQDARKLNDLYARLGTRE
jgi:glycosyltransferase involved in cell wall biosynthesis